MSAIKIRDETTTQLTFYLNCYFVKYINTLAHQTIYLVISSLDTQTKLIQTKVYYNVCYFVWEETTYKPLQIAAIKSLFTSMYVTGKNCFNNCF